VSARVLSLEKVPRIHGLAHVGDGVGGASVMVTPCAANPASTRGLRSPLASSTMGSVVFTRRRERTQRSASCAESMYEAVGSRRNDGRTYDRLKPSTSTMAAWPYRSVRRDDANGCEDLDASLHAAVGSTRVPCTVWHDDADARHSDACCGAHCGQPGMASKRGAVVRRWRSAAERRR
jgi:hypothetical protein